MASGKDSRCGMSVETTFGTRVAPARFFPFISEGIDYSFQRIFPPVVGTGLWGRPSRTSTQGGSGPFVLPVTTTGFGYLLNFLHGNTVTPVQQAATIAYLQTHTLSSPPSKSASIQIQTPPVSSSTLIPQDFTGAMFSGVEFSWGPDQEVRASFTLIPQSMDTSQSLATYTPPTAWSFFTLLDGAITIGGSNVTSVGGGGTLTISIPLRDDFYTLGSSGKIAKPVLNDQPTASATFTADFEDLTHWNRVANNTVADLVVTFTHPTAIVGTYFPYFKVTIPDCVFTSSRPQIDGPGPISQPVTATSASSASNSPAIALMSTDTTL